MKRVVITFAVFGLLTLACNFVTGALEGDSVDATPTTVSQPALLPPTPASKSAPAVTVTGASYYLGGDGCSDDGPGSEDRPYCTFDVALAGLQPGDALVIRAGVYRERLLVQGLSGRADSPIVIRGEDSQTVIFEGGCPEFPCALDEVNWLWDDETGMVTVEDSRHVTLMGFTVRGAIATGLTVFGGSDITVSDVIIRGTGNAGMLFKQTSGLTVTRNDIGNIQLGWRDEDGEAQAGAHEALSVVGVSNFAVYDNYVHDGLKEGIDVKESATGGEVHDNYIERTCGVGLYINEAHEVEVYDNRIRRSGYYLSDGREELCESYPIYGPMLGQFYGGGIMLAVGDLGELSQGRLSNIHVYRNVVWDLYGNGLEFWDQLRDERSGEGEMVGVQVYNNVFYNTSLAGVRLSDVQDSQVINNIIALNDEEAITGNSIDENRISNNLYFFRHEWQEPFGTAFVLGDPLFVDPAGGDFRLRPGSPAIDAGLSMGLSFRGEAPDIGAFEHGRVDISEVEHWLYLIDVNLGPDVVDQIAASSYDMVVLDFIPSEENNTDYPMAEVVSRFREARHPKLVIAYIDVGQAEEYRTYWQPDWGIGNPEWIAGSDPDGWEGNFPVAYWYDGWQELWLAPGGMIERIVNAGFDGVYLDWVEAYSDENVIEIAERDGLDARQEMIWWVEAIAESGRALRPEFLVISQNAAELVESDEYVAIIDAIAQEQVWFDGGADNDPPGDCPLPRTDAEVDTEAYRENLSAPCRRQYDEYPESTLHVSSEGYLHYLALAQSKGLVVFTVDYALESQNVDWVYRTSRALGYVPFVANRALDSFVAPYPR